MAADGADILIADCGLGNLHSVAAALRRVAPRADIRVSRDPEDIPRAAKIVLPGDGHFDACAREIRQRGMEAPLVRAAREKPFLGVCVGMQILYEASDEGDEQGLGVLPGRVRKLPEGGGRKIPHMGWNTVRARQRHPILDGMDDNARFYFIHGFYIPAPTHPPHPPTPPRPVDPSSVPVASPPAAPAVAVAEYGAEIAAVVARGALAAAQFHPEKSGRRGLQMLANFAHPQFAQRARPPA